MLISVLDNSFVKEKMSAEEMRNKALPLFLTKCEKELIECRKLITNSAIKGNFSVDCEVDTRCRDSFFKELHKDKYKLDYKGGWSWAGGDNPIYEKVRVSWRK